MVTCCTHRVDGRESEGLVEVEVVRGSRLLDGREGEFPDLHLAQLRAQQHRPEVSMPP